MKKIILFVSILSVFSCRKEVGPQSNNNTNNTEVYYDVLIGCEGNFGTGNGSLSAYSSSSNDLVNNYFDQINNYPLGDVVQSVEAIGGNLYIVVNNSGKIEVVDSASYISQGTITGFISPREIRKVDNGIAYVTDLYSNSIQVVDLVDNTIVSSIGVSGWTESILVNNGFAYVSSPGSNLIYKIDVTSHLLVDSINTGFSPLNLVLDKNNDLWVACSGNWGANDGTLERINLNTFLADQVVQLNASASELCINGDLNLLYWLSGGVYQMDVEQSSSSELIAASSGYFYGLGVHPVSGEVYVADAMDFVQAGKLFRYNNIGEVLDSATIGINPNAIFFK
tara:strand:- start:607 stop:1620 length:1014 start_codon:yes stop_codon:yes gene_type:complete